jgi:hypothetical protein
MITTTSPFLTVKLTPFKASNWSKDLQTFLAMTMSEFGSIFCSDALMAPVYRESAARANEIERSTRSDLRGTRRLEQTSNFHFIREV